MNNMGEIINRVISWNHDIPTDDAGYSVYNYVGVVGRNNVGAFHMLLISFMSLEHGVGE